MTEPAAPKFDWQVIAEKAALVANFPERFRIPVLIMKSVLALTREEKRADAGLLKKAILPNGENPDLADYAGKVIEGNNVRSNASLLAISLLQLANSADNSFIIDASKSK